MPREDQAIEAVRLLIESLRKMATELEAIIEKRDSERPDAADAE